VTTSESSASTEAAVGSQHGEAAAPPVDATDATVEPEGLPPPPASGIFLGTGRRKSAVARVRLSPGAGTISINGRPVDRYFTEIQERAAVIDPLAVTNTLGRFDVIVNVTGGGHSGQAGAIRLGVARALVRAEKRYEPVLRERGFLTRDSRIVERKKYGRRKARRRFQFSKR
jgi:small subunit ribosomal protein S9